MELARGPASPLLGTHPQDTTTGVHTDICGTATHRSQEMETTQRPPDRQGDIRNAAWTQPQKGRNLTRTALGNLDIMHRVEARQNKIHCNFHFEDVQTGRSTETERLVAARGGSCGKRGATANGHGLSFPWWWKRSNEFVVSVPQFSEPFKNQ